MFEKNNFKKLKQISVVDILNLLFLMTTLLGAFVSIYMNFVNRSLWLDEASLAYSFSTRSFWNLWNGALEKDQSAPLGWLYFEKILASIFGNTEFVIRLGSVIGFLLTLVLIWYLLKNCFHIKYPLGACAFYANMPFILKYSNVFKQYISEGFFVLLVILLFHLYDLGKINFKVLAASWAVLIWFANPTCFFQGGLLISAGIFVIVEKDWKRLKELVVTGVTIVISFVTYYFLWLREVALSDHMQNFWEGQNFPLFPTSYQDLKRMKGMIVEIFRHVGTYKWVFYVCIVVALIAAIIKKSRILIGLYIGILVTCFASYINMFPVQDRLWCFFYSIIVILGFVGIDEIMKWGSKSEKYGSFQTYVIGVMICILVFSNKGILTYLNKENVYWKGEEINREIEWLEENIKNDEMIYVFIGAVNGFQYKNGYGNHSFGGYENNVILGTTNFADGSLYEEDLQQIISKDKVYIACAHYVKDEYLSNLLDAAYENGYFQLVLFENRTPLWFWCKDLSDSKIHVSYEVMERAEDEDTVNIILRIHNDGEAYLNHNWETVSLVNCEDGNRIEIKKNIVPGESVDMLVSYKKGSNPSFRLENEYGLICEDSDIKIDEVVR